MIESECAKFESLNPLERPSTSGRVLQMGQQTVAMDRTVIIVKKICAKKQKVIISELIGKKKKMEVTSLGALLSSKNINS